MIHTQSSRFDVDIRMSPQPLFALYFGLTMISAVVMEMLRWQARAVPFAVLIWGLSIAGWLLCNWRPAVGRWLAIAIPAVAALAAHSGLGLANVLPFLALPVVLAAALVGIRASVGVTFVQSLVLLQWWRLGRADAGDVVVTLALCWATCGAMIYVYRPVYDLVEWSWQHFLQAQQLLDEARDRSAELKQTLADLADANLQLTRLNRLTQGLRQAAEDARHAKEQFVANLSHELRTPLNMIIGFSEMILQAPQAYGPGVPHALLADLEVVLRNSQHLSALIEDVLDLSQIEAGQMSLTKERVSMGEIVEAAATAVRPLYESRGLCLELAVEPDLPPVFCDRTRIREVLLNLLSNAGRFTEQGGVHVCAWRERADIEVTVADTGPGIPAEDAGRLFRPFQQLDGSIRRRHGGSGLGLAISKSFVELHGGRMWFESDLGRGTTFHFRLPIDPPLPLASSATRWINPYLPYEERPQRPVAPVAELRPRYVLLDAGGSLTRLLARHLDNAEIVSVANLEEASQELARVPAQALVVNGSSVSETLQQVLAEASLPYGTPAIICSMPGLSTAAEALGADGYLIKPISPAALLGALEGIQPRGKTVLVVDDEPDALQLFRRTLRASGQGYRVLSAGDGRQALAILRQQRVDALLVDLAMPEMDGFQLLAVKNQDPALRGIPSVIISARDPTGQPILANALAVTRAGGLSTAQLLDAIAALTRILSPIPPPADRALQAAPAG